MNLEASPPRSEEELTDGELTNLVNLCREWSHAIDDIRGYTRTGASSRNTTPEMRAAAKQLNKSNYFLKREFIAQFLKRIRDARRPGSPFYGVERVIPSSLESIEEIRDEIYQDTAALNGLLTAIDLPKDSLLRPTRLLAPKQNVTQQSAPTSHSPKLDEILARKNFRDRRAGMVELAREELRVIWNDERRIELWSSHRNRPRDSVWSAFIESWVQENRQSVIAKAFGMSKQEVRKLFHEIDSKINKKMAYAIVGICEEVDCDTIRRSLLERKMRTKSP
jgi:hypothetical protein